MVESLLWVAIVTVLVSPALFLLRDRRAPEVSETEPITGGLPLLSPEPCLHVVPNDVAEFVIPDFRPGIDRCHVALNDPEAEFEAVLDKDGVRFQFLDTGSFLEVVFPGLIDPPFEDTQVFGPGPAEAGRVLSELVGRARPQGPGFHRVRSEIAAFQEFSAAEEVVEVWVPPDIDALPRIDVRPSLDGSDGEVMIDGRPAARLCGAPNAGIGNIQIVRKMPEDFGESGVMTA